ncbi:hypothetical protein CEK00_09575 [Stenotrophomonas maltophilia]|uniref:PrgH/EprH family type III secretion apparatus protein n=1 Tax=Stenotrophomonas maltophilia TaxID=40324 RepID=A0A270MXQ8_STEMA|nr:PrgH/EprH family type III secretion apparatus protein [Stenotrophomonas maltophilia]PAM64673.1 hypothetical protein CEK00_21895 [Stenotrophomonas maltophilia]PAM71830.1 hypothetical protein CEK00_09575 [Stenotrophomonas maltophilia]
MIKLKILSGPFAGLEYNLEPGDTVLQLVHDIAASASVSGLALSAAQNVFLVAAAAECGRLIVRYGQSGDSGSVMIAEQRDGAADADPFVPVMMNQPQRHFGLHLAIADVDAPWDASVLEFVPPVSAITPDARPLHAEKQQKRRWLPSTLVAVSLVAATFIGVGYYLNLPDVQVGKLSSALQHAPGRYEVVAGEDRTLYVFAEDAAAAAWAERAVLRADRWNAQVLIRQAERERVEAWLIRQGLQPVIVRLEKAASTEVVLSVIPSEPALQRIQRLAKAEMPYAHQLKISGISDAALVAMVRDELKTLGVTTRTDMLDGRTSISNTVFLDDATLAAVAAYSKQFEQRWGARRVTVNARLWDDVLRGRSFRYSPGQLMSVGQGSWEYSKNLR